MFRAAFSETPNYCRIIRLTKSNFKLESKFSRIQLRQPSQQSCAYFKINRIDELSSTFALGLTHNIWNTIVTCVLQSIVVLSSFESPSFVVFRDSDHVSCECDREIAIITR